jgi:hypothetical protein
MNDRDKLLRKWRKVKTKSLKDQFKFKRNLVNTQVRNAKSEYTKSLLRENANDPTSFWKSLKKVFPMKTKPCHVEQSFIINGQKETDPVNICEGFSQYFSTIVTTLKRASYPFVNFVWKKTSLILCKNI